MSKPKAYWLTLLGVSVLLCVQVAWSWYARVDTWRIGVQSGAVLFSGPASPTLWWGPWEAFADLGLQPVSVGRYDLNQATDSVSERVGSTGSHYQVVQPGLTLLWLDKTRVWLITDPFEPTDLDPTKHLEYSGDWVVLQRSSLLPSAWPEPSQGWVVLNTGTLSAALTERSLVAQKPIIRPESAGTVWLEALPAHWQVLVPDRDN